MTYRKSDFPFKTLDTQITTFLPDHDAHETHRWKLPVFELATQLPHADRIANTCQRRNRALDRWPVLSILTRCSYESVTKRLYLSRHYRYLVELCLRQHNKLDETADYYSCLVQGKIISSSHNHKFISLFTAHFITHNKYKLIFILLHNTVFHTGSYLMKNLHPSFNWFGIII